MRKINKEDFSKIIAHLINEYEISCKYLDLLNVENPLSTENQKGDELFLSLLFDKEQISWINWYIYDYICSPVHKIIKNPSINTARSFDKEGKPIAYDVDSLYDWLFKKPIKYK